MSVLFTPPLFSLLLQMTTEVHTIAHDLTSCCLYHSKLEAAKKERNAAQSAPNLPLGMHDDNTHFIDDFITEQNFSDIFMDSDLIASIPFRAHQGTSYSDLIASIPNGIHQGVLDNEVTRHEILQEILVDSNDESHQSTFSDMSTASEVKHLCKVIC